jgi:regulator of sirC expression with transglutaminase-like and TPR domain
MEGSNPGRRRLQLILRRPDKQIDLVEAALAIAWEDLGTIDLDGARQRLDELGMRAQEQLGLHRPVPDQAKQLVDYLHRTEGFQGNTEDYDDPTNSYLPLVLERRVGLPITLALLLLHVGQAIKLPLEPAALPGHFMVRCPTSQGPLFLDLFYGQVLNTAQCRLFLQNQLGYEVPNPERFPRPSHRQVIVRVLRNLKSCYFKREDWTRTLAATERILLIEPDSGDDLRDRGLLRAQVGQLHLALLDLDRYARLSAGAADLDMVRKQAIMLAQVLGRKN